MKVEYIHIGQGKVLSTFLQKEIFNKIDTHVWSDELLSGLVLNWRSGAATRDIMLHGLKKLHPNAKIIICVRKNKDSWIKSIYSQYVKQGGFKSFNKWFFEDFDEKFLEIDTYISNINKLFNEVYVLYFEKFLKDKEGEIEKLCDFIGCKVPSDIDYNKRYNQKWTGFRLLIGRFRSFLFKASRILLELDKTA
jgi:hypothetical protein